jgi:PhzF family phenazine biosynthesis protein
MSVAETAFLVKRENGFSLRWFTPEAEVALCGHATLASAHILFERGILLPGEKAVFHTKSGELYAEKRDGKIQLNFPCEPATECAPLEGLKEALDCELVWCGRNRMDCLVELAEEELVRSLRPDFIKLAAISGVRGFIVTAKGKSYDFISRFFAPAIGVPEDPVTGSAHCCLAPYWGEKLHKTSFLAYQASRRGGEVGCRLQGERVLLLGSAVTTMDIELHTEE